MNLPIDCVEYIFNNDLLFTLNDFELLKLLIKYYSEYKKDDNKEIKKVINELLLKIDFSEIYFDALTKNEIELLSDFECVELVKCYSKNMKKRVSIKLECDLITKGIVLKYYRSCENGFTINSILFIFNRKRYNKIIKR